MPCGTEGQGCCGAQACGGEGEGQLHPLWREVACLDGCTFYLNPASGQLSRTRFPPPPPVPGGILADEMVCRL